MRPVKLKTIVRGYSPTKTDFLFERRLNDHVTDVVADFSKGRPALVFCRCLLLAVLLDCSGYSFDMHRQQQ